MGGQLRSWKGGQWEDTVLGKEMVKGDALICHYIGNPASRGIEATWFGLSSGDKNVLLAASPAPQLLSIPRGAHCVQPRGWCGARMLDPDQFPTP